MQTLNRLCGTGYHENSTKNVALRFCAEKTEEGQLRHYSLHGIAFKELLTPKIFKDENGAVEYILNLHEPVKIKKEAPPHIALLHIQQNAIEVARSTRRGPGNFILAGTEMYQHLSKFADQFTKAISLEEDVNIPSDIAILFYRPSPNGPISVNGEIPQIDWGFFYGESEGKIELYEFEQDTKFGDNTILSKSQDYYVLFKLID